MWVSVLLAIPLSILANLLTPRFQKMIDRASEKNRTRTISEQVAKASQQLAEILREVELVTKYHTDRPLFHQYMLVMLLRVTLYGAVGGIYGSCLGMLGEMVSWNGILGANSRIGVQLVALFTSMMIVIACTRAIRLHQEVRDYDKFKEESQNRIIRLRQIVSQQSPPPYSSPATGSESGEA